MDIKTYIRERVPRPLTTVLLSSVLVLIASYIYEHHLRNTSVDFMGNIPIFLFIGFANGWLLAGEKHYVLKSFGVGVIYIILSLLPRLPLYIYEFGRYGWEAGFFSNHVVHQLVAYMLAVLIVIAFAKRTWQLTRTDLVVFIVPLFFATSKIITAYTAHYLGQSVYDYYGQINMFFVFIFGCYLARVGYFSRSPSKSFFILASSYLFANVLTWSADYYWYGGCLSIVERIYAIDCGYVLNPGFRLGYYWLSSFVSALIIGWLPYRIVSFVWRKIVELKEKKTKSINMDQDKKNKTVIIIVSSVLLGCLAVVGLWVFVPYAQQALNERKEKSVEAELMSAQKENEKNISQQKVQQDAVAAANLKLADPKKEKECGVTGLEYFRYKSNPTVPQSIVGATLIASHYNSRMSACLILVNSNRIAFVYDIKGDIQIMSSARGTTSFTPESELKEYITISTLMSE